jgi:c-di-GMP-binding flagellar brake protein YcgR
MDNNRKHDRFKSRAYCSVFDTIKKISLGILVDLSVSGLQIMGEEELYAGPLFKLQIDMPKEVMNSRVLFVDAKCVWCKKDVDPKFYRSGFEFFNLSERTKERIKAYLKSSTFRSPKFYKDALNATEE